MMKLFLVGTLLRCWQLAVGLLACMPKNVSGKRVQLEKRTIGLCSLSETIGNVVVDGVKYLLAVVGKTVRA